MGNASRMTPSFRDFPLQAKRDLNMQWQAEVGKVHRQSISLVVRVDGMGDAKVFYSV